MSKLHTSVLTAEANSLFNRLSSSQELEGVTLIGGTALALQINHRISLDFDFAIFESELLTYKIDSLITILKQEGYKVKEIVDSSNEARHRINTGMHLRDQVRDYVVNGIKLTFFAHGRNNIQREYYQKAEKVSVDNAYFNLLGLEGLKTSKTLVLADRATSRDLYDLKILMDEYDYTIEGIEKIITQIGHLDDLEHYRAVMTGLYPLDKNDPGLLPVKVKYDVTELYNFFEHKFEEYDINLATQAFSS